MGGRFIGIMSGTSLDGVDAVLAEFDDHGRPTLRAAASRPFSPELRASLLSLQRSGPDELERAARAANALVDVQAELVAALRADDAVPVVALGTHGQTVRHRPDAGFTIQINAPARLAERTGLTVVSDFRSRDVAAGGQGAPLVPAFHDAVFRLPGRSRVILNLGGMSNVTDLPAAADADVRGWDCGPGNVLLDGWVQRHRGESCDRSGAWAAAGRVDDPLLARLSAHPWFALPPPKSTGRDLFDSDWLDVVLADGPSVSPIDVQATLAALTATTIAASVVTHVPSREELIVCGGGAYNADLLARLRSAFVERGKPVIVTTSSDHGIAPEHVEALAFAWLAMRCMTGQTGNLPAVTGARGARVLGAIHRA